MEASVSFSAWVGETVVTLVKTILTSKQKPKVWRASFSKNASSKVKVMKDVQKKLWAQSSDKECVMCQWQWFLTAALA